MKHPHLLAILCLACVVVATYYAVLLPPRTIIAQDSPTASVALGRQRILEGKKIVWNTDGYLGRGGGVGRGRQQREAGEENLAREEAHVQETALMRCGPERAPPGGLNSSPARRPRPPTTPA